MIDVNETDRISLARLETRFEGIETMLTEVRDTLKSGVVTKSEWSLRNGYVDAALSNLEKDVTEIKGKSAPWWSVVTVVAALAAVGWQIVQPLVLMVLGR